MCLLCKNGTQPRPLHRFAFTEVFPELTVRPRPSRPYYRPNSFVCVHPSTLARTRGRVFPGKPSVLQGFVLDCPCP